MFVEARLGYIARTVIVSNLVEAACNGYHSHVRASRYLGALGNALGIGVRIHAQIRKLRSRALLGCHSLVLGEFGQLQTHELLGCLARNLRKLLENIACELGVLYLVIAALFGNQQCKRVYRQPPCPRNFICAILGRYEEIAGLYDLDRHHGLGSGCRSGNGRGRGRGNRCRRRRFNRHRWRRRDIH